MRPSTQRKRDAALTAAEHLFLTIGYESVTMEAIAAESGVAKQTLYNYFGSKRDLFLDLVTAKTTGASDSVLSPAPEIPFDNARAALRALLLAQLSAVMSPSILALRRLVIGERTRSPELAEALYEHGPKRAVSVLAKVIEQLDAAGVLEVQEPQRAAQQLNWLVMGEPVNRAMLLGDEAIPTSTEMEEHVDSALDVFFRAHRAIRA